MAKSTEGASTTLQRGRACLRCRKRKMKCDGVKPACQQCSRAKKADCCEYDDGKGKTRTQLLRENISRLEDRIRQLEDPANNININNNNSPSVTLYNPTNSRSGSQSSLSIGSPEDILQRTYSPTHSDPSGSPHSSWLHSPATHSPKPFEFDLFFGDPNPPLELSLMLLDIFTPHRHQAGLEIHIPLLRDSLSLPLQNQRHPSLINAIFLWACFVSRPEALAAHEDLYLSQTIDSLNKDVTSGEKLVDCVRAMCLLSTYFLANGRLIEGSHYASSATALAVQCKLHRPISSSFESSGPSWGLDEEDAFSLPPPANAIDQGERISAFWQVFNLDRCWSVVLHKPPMIPDGRHLTNSINAPWPLSMPEYELGNSDESTPQGGLVQTIRGFLEGTSAGGFSTGALRAKASALFQLSDQLSSTWDPRISSAASFIEEVRALEILVDGFLPTLLPVHQQMSDSAEDRYILISTHTLAHTSIIHLYRKFAPDDQRCYDACMRSARACLSIVKSLTDSDFGFIEPIVGPCWNVVSELLINELNSIEAAWPLLSSVEVRGELGVMLYALNSLGIRFPFVRGMVAKIQNRLSDL